MTHEAFLDNAQQFELNWSIFDDFITIFLYYGAFDPGNYFIRTRLVTIPQLELVPQDNECSAKTLLADV